MDKIRDSIQNNEKEFDLASERYIKTSKFLDQCQNDIFALREELEKVE
ncbi:MAG: hypothetical protein P8I94_08790 [Emcibacteraceae bacterium]|nr:hypothetical protein [Emcibacteraceae bacterium]